MSNIRRHEMHTVINVDSALPEAIAVPKEVQRTSYKASGGGGDESVSDAHVKILIIILFRDKMIFNVLTL